MEEEINLGGNGVGAEKIMANIASSFIHFLLGSEGLTRCSNSTEINGYSYHRLLVSHINHREL